MESYRSMIMLLHSLEDFLQVLSPVAKKLIVLSELDIVRIRITPVPHRI